MKIELESTDKIVFLNGVEARLWQGKTDSGIECHAFIARIAVHKNADTSQFERELKEQATPRPEFAVYPRRMIV